MFNEATIREIVLQTVAEGVPSDIACLLEQDLLNAMFVLRKRMGRVERHTEILEMVTRCHGKVAVAAEKLAVTPRAVYLHLENKLKRKG